MMNPVIERHQHQHTGVLSCFNHLIVTGNLPEIAYAGAMERFFGNRDTSVCSTTLVGPSRCEMSFVAMPNRWPLRQD